MGIVKRTLTADYLYATGVRDRWYAICPSSFVGPGAMKAVTRLGENWLLFRELNGTLHMLEDRCPHRGAPLSQGLHMGDRIACAYHGVQVDGAGTVASVPGMPGCKLEGRTVVPSLPVREAAGAVFAYVPAGADAKPCELTLPPGLDDEEVSSFLCYAEWDAPWRFAMENVMDPMHGAFLHRDSHTMYAGDSSAQFRIAETERGYRFEKTTQQGVNFDWVEYAFTGADWLQLSIPYPPTAGPGGPFGITFMVTAVDERRCAIFSWRTRKSAGWERSAWRFLYKTRIEERHWVVLEQDRRMLEAMAADADQAENLYQHDLGLVRIRRVFQRAARDQAAAMAEGA